MEKATESPSSESSVHDAPEKTEINPIATETHERQESMNEIKRETTRGTNVSESDIEYPSSWKLAIIMVALCLAVFCMALDNTIIATAIPRITTDFNSLGDVGWYASAYLLTTCAFQLFYGKLYTYFSVKWVFMVALLLFEVGSAVCGAAPDSPSLIVGRAIAGLGSAGIFSGGILILSHSVPLAKRPIYTGLIGGMYGIASVAGPLLGGVFTDSYLTWRWCFYINLPLGAVTAIFLFFFFHAPGKQARKDIVWRDSWRTMDFPGLFTLVPAVICILLALQWGGSEYEWSNYRIIVLFVFFGVLAIAFGLIQVWAGENATVPLRIIRQRSVAGACIFSVFFGASFFVLVYFVPLWFQATKGVDATESGIDILPMILAVTVFSILSGAVVTVQGQYAPWLIFASVVMSAGSGSLTTFKPSTESPTWIGLQVLYGVGAGSGIQMSLMAVQTVLPMKDVPVGTAVLIFSQMFGGSLFVSVAQNVFSNQLLKNLRDLVPQFPPGVVIQAGATAVNNVVPPRFLPQVLQAYSLSLTQTWYVAVATSCLSLIGAAMVEWKSMKAKKEDRYSV